MSLLYRMVLTSMVLHTCMSLYVRILRIFKGLGFRKNATLASKMRSNALANLWPIAHHPPPTTRSAPTLVAAGTRDLKVGDAAPALWPLWNAVRPAVGARGVFATVILTVLQVCIGARSAAAMAAAAFCAGRGKGQNHKICAASVAARNVGCMLIEGCLPGWLLRALSASLRPPGPPLPAAPCTLCLVAGPTASCERC
jgi:hypothetical protein